ncbi:unnamed protein product [Boreogadus saida]
MGPPPVLPRMASGPSVDGTGLWSSVGSSSLIGRLEDVARRRNARLRFPADGGSELRGRKGAPRRTGRATRESQVRCSTYQVRCSTYQVGCSTYQVRCSTYQVRCSTYQGSYWTTEHLYQTDT